MEENTEQPGEEEKELKFNDVNFIYDKSMLTIGTSIGYIILKTDPIVILANRNLNIGIKTCLMLDRTNLMFLLAKEEDDIFSPNKIILYDDIKGKPVTELKMAGPIANFKVNSKHLFVLIEKFLFIFNTKKFSKIDKLPCYPDKEGVCALCENRDQTHFVYQDPEKGYCNVLSYVDEKFKSTRIFCHNSKIAKLAINTEGTLILSSSDNGTLVRCFETATGKIIGEFRRGNDVAKIFSLAFSPDNEYFACTSDLGTLHVFKKSDANTFIQPKVKKTGFLSKLSGFFRTSTGSKDAKRCFAQLKTNEEVSYCTFNLHGSIFLVSCNTPEKFYNINFDKEAGGDINDVTITQIMNEEEEKKEEEKKV